MLQQGIVLLGQGRFGEAHTLFLSVLEQQPAAIEPRIGLSNACQGLGDRFSASAWISDACRTAPQRQELWVELARQLMTQQREDELEGMLTTALALHPDHAALLQTQGELYLRRKKYAEALKAYERLVEHLPADPTTLLHLGFCQEQVGAVEKAVGFYRRAIAARPGFMEAHVDMAGVLWRVGDFDGALEHARRAVEIAPNEPYAVRILGTALLNLNRVDEAELAFRRALELKPGFILAEIDLSFALLLAGRLEEGFSMYAQRWRDEDRMRRPSFYRPDLEWKGREQQPARGKRIAVYAEQGIGDVIQFARYVHLLQADGATVHGVVQPELVDLLEASLEGFQCLTAQRSLEADHHVALLDLPMHYGTSLATIPGRVPYLRPRAEAVERWASLLPPRDGRTRVGIAWSGSRAQVNNQNRAMRLSQLAPLFTSGDLQCFSLQKGDAGPFTDVMPAEGQLLDFTGQWNDFTDSAAMIANLDLVICVDTSVAHLAGAMGKEVWVLLAPNADWRWLLHRDDSPWYPGMRLFRRGFGETRALQVQRVMQALAARLT